MSGSDDRRRQRRRSRSRSRSRPDRQRRSRSRSRNRRRPRRRGPSYSPPPRPPREHWHPNGLPQRDSREKRNYKDALAAGLDSEQDNVPYDGQAAYERPASVLRVENLPPDVDDAELRELFSKVPGVVSIVPQRAGKDEPCVGYAVLAMPTVLAAQELMDTEWRDNAYYRQHRLRLTYSNSDPRSLPNDDADWVCPSCLGVNYPRRVECYTCRVPRTVDCRPVDPHAPSCVIKVGNLGPAITEEILEFAVKPVAPVKDVHVPRDRHTGECRGHGFLTFFNEEDAELVMQRLDGTKLEGERWSLRMSYDHVHGRGAEKKAPDRYGRGEREDDNAPTTAEENIQGGANASSSHAIEALGWEPKSFEELAAEAAAEEAVAPTAAAAVVDVSDVPAGFDYDVNTGYYRDPVSGYLYDSTTKYYFHPQQQVWGIRDSITGELAPVVHTSASGPEEILGAKTVNAVSVSGAVPGAGAGSAAGITSRDISRVSQGHALDSSAVIGAAPQLNIEALAEARQSGATPSVTTAGSTQALKGVIHRGKWAQRMQQRNITNNKSSE